ncbi:hypothetical protein D3C86_1493450 [compost metagenome]
MAPGIWALGIDGASNDLDEGVEQLLLPSLHALAFYAGRRRAGYRLDESNAIVAKLVQVRRLAGVRVQQRQDAHGFIAAVVQANSDEMNARTLQLVEYAA